MIYLCYALCFAMALCFINIYCKTFYHKTAKELLGKWKLMLYVMLLGSFLCWGGAKPDLPDEPDEPDPPDPPDPPIVENVRIKLIGRVNEDGKFVPLTSQWQDITVTNGVIDATTIEGINNNE